MSLVKSVVSASQVNGPYSEELRFGEHLSRQRQSQACEHALCGRREQPAAALALFGCDRAFRFVSLLDQQNAGLFAEEARESRSRGAGADDCHVIHLQPRS
jgi:hypothetical protein